jgi:hypothetical protein
MNIAYTMAQGRGDTDLLLQRLARGLSARGLRCRGTVQINTEPTDCVGPCDMDVLVLPDGPVLRISQDLGPSARGCRLDAALEQAVAQVGARLREGADILIVNKFGKHEAEGRGFREVIAEALSMDLPVIVGLNAMNRPAFESFASGLAVELPAEHDALLNWVEEVAGVRV